MTLNKMKVFELDPDCGFTRLDPHTKLPLSVNTVYPDGYYTSLDVKAETKKFNDFGRNLHKKLRPRKVSYTEAQMSI